MRWIPLDERLPLQGNKVLVCKSDGNIEKAFLGTPPAGMSLRNYWKTDFNNTINGVVAWMPLPVTYQEVGNRDFFRDTELIVGHLLDALNKNILGIRDVIRNVANDPEVR